MFSDIKWIDSSRFRVLSSVCDTFLPTFDIDSLSVNDIKNHFNDLCPKLIEIAPNLISDTEIERIKTHKEYFNLSASMMKIPEIGTQAVESFCLSGDQIKIYAILWLFSTSIGNFFLTGYFRPFTSLNLTERTKSMVGLKYSYFSPLRAVFMVKDFPTIVNRII